MEEQVPYHKFFIIYCDDDLVVIILKAINFCPDNLFLLFITVSSCTNKSEKR